MVICFSMFFYYLKLRLDISLCFFSWHLLNQYKITYWGLLDLYYIALKVPNRNKIIKLMLLFNIYVLYLEILMLKHCFLEFFI